MPLEPLHILIPCKGLSAGKTRLSACLDAERRRALCHELLTQTLQRALALAAQDRVRIVTSDPDALALAARHGVAGLPDPALGLNAALEAARASLLNESRPVDAILILPIDLPYASRRTITKAMVRRGEVVIAPDEDGTGTNLLLLRSPALRVLPFAFGPGSFAAHLAAVRARGLTVAVFRDRRAAFDIDGPAQYEQWRSRWARDRLELSIATPI